MLGPLNTVDASAVLGERRPGLHVFGPDRRDGVVVLGASVETRHGPVNLQIEAPEAVARQVLEPVKRWIGPARETAFRAAELFEAIEDQIAHLDRAPPAVGAAPLPPALMGPSVAIDLGAALRDPTGGVATVEVEGTPVDVAAADFELARAIASGDDAAKARADKLPAPLALRLRAARLVLQIWADPDKLASVKERAAAGHERAQSVCAALVIAQIVAMKDRAETLALAIALRETEAIAEATSILETAIEGDYFSQMMASMLREAMAETERARANDAGGEDAADAAELVAIVEGKPSEGCGCSGGATCSGDAAGASCAEGS